MPFQELLGTSGTILLSLLISYLQMLTKFQFLFSGFDALDKLGWINVVFAMTTASFIPLYGSFSDIFGVS